MTNTQEYHPTLAELQAFDSGQLMPAEREAIESHLERCVACCDALDALPEGALEALVRAYGGSTENLSFSPKTNENLPGAPSIPAEFVAHPRYRILGFLGAGGMGVVYKAIHRLMERVVALKVLNQSLTTRPGFAERFRREVKAAARLSHPNIVTAYDADEAAGTHFLVMEYVPGTTLDRVVVRQGPLPVREACDLVCQAAHGLQHAHERGLVHCDIKPHNLVLTSTGQVKILDFGLARLMEEGGTGAVTLPSGTLLGTPDYVAPEQARDPRCADIRADIYSLGCTLYHLLAGRPPFPTGTPLQKLLAHQECSPPGLTVLREDVPQELTRILDRMLAKDPGKRYQTPMDLAADLECILAPTRTPLSVERQGSARRLIFWVAGLIAAVSSFALVAYLVVVAVSPIIRSHDREAKGTSEQRPSSAESQELGVEADPTGLESDEASAQKKRQVRDRVARWIRENGRRSVGDSVSTYVASQIDKDLKGAEALHVLLGSGLTLSSKAVLLAGRAGELQVFELKPALTRGVDPGSCRVQNYSTGEDQRRAVPRVLLTDLNVEQADLFFPDRPVTGSVGYRMLGRWPGEYALRLTFYFGKHNRYVTLPRPALPETGEGILPFSFPILGAPDEFVPGPDTVFVEVISQDSGSTIVESNGPAALVHVMSPETPRPK